MIRFRATPEIIENHLILRVPKSDSAQLPSRNMAYVHGTINGVEFAAPLESDGQKSHWLDIDSVLRKRAKLQNEATVTLAIEPIYQWPEPNVPSDLQHALENDTAVNEIWHDITVVSRWDWIRWINGTKNPATRAGRIEKTMSKLRDGKRRACSFNRTECTDPDISRSGVLL